MRVLFLGQKPIGEKCFEILRNHRNKNLEIAGAVSNRDKDGVWWGNNSIYEACQEDGLIFIDNGKKNEKVIMDAITKNNIDMLISVGHSYILSHEVLSAVSYHTANLHLAKLPDYKGNFTYNHAILNGEKTYGVTLHRMADEVDQGDYIFIEEFPIRSDDTAYSLYIRALEAGEKLFEKFVGYLSDGIELPCEPMEGEGAFYSRTSLDGLREIRDISEISVKSRAFYFPPFENAYFCIDGAKYYVLPPSYESENDK